MVIFHSYVSLPEGIVYEPIDPSIGNPFQSVELGHPLGLMNHSHCNNPLKLFTTRVTRVI